eukprot:1892078-Amphidinium_carterae.1
MMLTTLSKLTRVTVYVRGQLPDMLPGDDEDVLLAGQSVADLTPRTPNDFGCACWLSIIEPARAKS